MNTLIKALHFAAEQHRNQRRRDADQTPYINHPIALVNVLANEAGIDDVVVLCAAMLHDTIEDTNTTEAELQAAFGADITKVVLEVTDDKSLDKAQRKQLQIEHASHSSHQAKLVKLADKICNLRDIAANPPTTWSAQRKLAYFDWSAAVVAGLRGTHAELESLFDKVCARKGEFKD